MNNQNEQLILWLRENLKRLFTKSPKFFRVWQAISVIAMAITGVPELLEFFGVILPPTIALFASKFIASVSMGALLMSKLTTQSTPLLIRGDVVKITDTKALPFTAVAEQKVVNEMRK